MSSSAAPARRLLAARSLEDLWCRRDRGRMLAHLPTPATEVMLHLAQFVATISAAIFAGAAVYINVVEHPARMSLDTRAAALEWASGYRRATWMQAPLALLSLVAGLVSWWLGGGAMWAIAAVLIGAVVPFTLLGIMPTNRCLLAPGRDLGSAETRALLGRWAGLHGVRTGLSLLAAAVDVWKLSAA